VFNGISFGAVVISLCLLKTAELHYHPKASHTDGGFIGGLRYAWSKPELISILFMLFLMGAVGMNFPIIIAAMAVGDLHTDARGFGLLTSIMAVGTLSGALIGASRKNTGYATILLGAGMFGVSAALGAVAPGYWAFAGVLVVMGVATLTFQNASTSVMQLSTAPSMRGRIMALRLAILFGVAPLGAPVVGWIADTFGARWSLVAAGVSAFAAAAVGLTYLMLARRVGDGQGDLVTTHVRGASESVDHSDQEGSAELERGVR
jgi:MFS family permease